MLTLMNRALLSRFIGLVSLLTLFTVLGCNGRGGEPPGNDQPDLAQTLPRPDGGGVAPTARLTGKVFAPNGTIPIAGALVYLTTTPPPAIPDGVFCDRCVRLPEGTPYTQTAVDGTFSLGTGTGAGYLVVQKGAFRRVRSIDVQKGDQAVPVAMTTMPAIMDKANGDDVPKIAVVVGAWDPIEVVLARMGLKATITRDLLGKARVLGKDASGFAIYGVQNLGEMSPYPSPNVLLTDPNELGKYHILFLPCSGGTNSMGNGPQCTGVFNSDARVKANLNSFVQKGGRVYVSDWSYEYVRQVFPGFVSWQGETSTIGSACGGGGGDQVVRSKDQGLGDWLSAQGQDLSEVKDAWTALAGVRTQMGPDLEGKPTMITPRVWVSAASPTTVSFRYGCGRVLYTTYHTQPSSETNGPLEAQALALLYLILEVGVCIDPVVLG